MAFTARIYRSLAGSYLALLVGPAVPTVAAIAGLAADRWLLFSLGALVAGAVGFALASTIDMVQWLTNQWVAIVATTLPLAYLVWLIALLAHNPNKTLLTLLGRPSAAGVFAFGVALTAIVLAGRQVTVERIRQSTVYTSFTASPTPRRRRIRYASFAIALGTVAGLLVVLAIDGAISSVVLVAGVSLLPLLVIGLYSTQQRSFVVTDQGLAMDGTFTEWRRFESYELTDRSLILRPRSKWLGNLAVDVTDVSGLETIQTALDDHLTDRST